MIMVRMPAKSRSAKFLVRRLIPTRFMQIEALRREASSRDHSGRLNPGELIHWSIFIAMSA